MIKSLALLDRERKLNIDLQNIDGLSWKLGVRKFMVCQKTNISAESVICNLLISFRFMTPGSTSDGNLQVSLKNRD